MTKPLLGLEGPPDFPGIDIASIELSIEALLAQAYAALESAKDPATRADYDALSTELDEPVEKLGYAWTVVSHLHAVVDSPKLRSCYQTCLPRITAFYSALGGDVGLYEKYRALATDPALTPERKRRLALTVQSATLAGVGLEGSDKQRFNDLMERSAALSQRFATNLLDATDRYAYYADATEVDGISPEVLSAARRAAQADGKDGYRLSLQMSMYGAVMRQASNRDLRETLYRAYITRASEFGPTELDNTQVMAELLSVRLERAALLGLANHAQVSLALKMADDPEQVISFLRQLAGSARETADREFDELRAFAKEALQLDELHAWDVAYASERLRQARYAFSQDDVKRYFTVERVLSGLLDLMQRLFDVSVVRTDLPTWHDTVTAYKVSRRGEELGVFYLDLFARAGKRNGAWVNGIQPRWRRQSRVRQAISTLVCNFTPPDENGVSMLGHDELVTLCHEFGHNLHFLLSTVDELGVSGFSGVEWDAVELPSQLMENLAWQWEVVESLSCHVDDGSSLPRALFEKMRAAKNFQGGLSLLRQVDFALLDLMLHTAPAGTDVQAMVERVRAEVVPIPVPSFYRFAHSFSHIFAGGYAAGYYSYLWAEVLSADAWSAFEEEGVFNVGAWRRFSKAVLEIGGSRPAADNFAAFRGRPPIQDALLRQRGIPRILS